MIANDVDLQYPREREEAQGTITVKALDLVR